MLSKDNLGAKEEDVSNTLIPIAFEYGKSYTDFVTYIEFGMELYLWNGLYKVQLQDKRRNKKTGLRIFQISRQVCLIGRELLRLESSTMHFIYLGYDLIE